MQGYRDRQVKLTHMFLEKVSLAMLRCKYGGLDMQQHWHPIISISPSVLTMLHQTLYSRWMLWSVSKRVYSYSLILFHEHVRNMFGVRALFFNVVLHRVDVLQFLLSELASQISCSIEMLLHLVRVYNGLPTLGCLSVNDAWKYPDTNGA